MSLSSVEYICPTIVLIIIFLLKLTVDERTSFENFKRLSIETTVDVMSLATSFVISYVIVSAARVNAAEVGSRMLGDFYGGIIVLVIFILCLIITVLCSKYSIRKYVETEQLRFILIGIAIGYTISIFCLIYSIILLRNLGGAQ